MSPCVECSSVAQSIDVKTLITSITSKMLFLHVQIIKHNIQDHEKRTRTHNHNTPFYLVGTTSHKMILRSFSPVLIKYLQTSMGRS